MFVGYSYCCFFLRFECKCILIGVIDVIVIGDIFGGFWYGIDVMGGFYCRVYKLLVDGCVMYFVCVVKSSGCFWYNKWCMVYVFNVVGND